MNKIVSMNKILYALAVVVMMVSCAESYNVQGSSSISSLDGNMMYLRTVKSNEIKTIDSCDVVHGRFQLSGVLDTVRMATLFIGDESVMPVVLESGQITIKIDNATQTVSGTPLNEKLYQFLKKHNQLDNRMSELSHRQSQMMLEGIEEHIINEELSREAGKIAKEEDKLVTTFIVENFDNVLGPGVFMMITSGYRYPILTPQIEDIMSKATEKFKNNPYVKDYYQTATDNENRMQGLDPSDEMPAPIAEEEQTKPESSVDSTENTELSGDIQ